MGLGEEVVELPLSVISIQAKTVLRRKSPAYKDTVSTALKVAIAFLIRLLQLRHFAGLWCRFPCID